MARARCNAIPGSLHMNRSQAEVVKLLFSGMNFAEIAKARGTSRETVETQLRQVCHKAKVKTTLKLVALAWKQKGFLW